jgi:hypothetical protein
VASPKNNTRRKRKYDDRRKVRTVSNKKRKIKASEARIERLVERTRELIGKHVEVRIKGQDRPQVGTVVEVLHKGDEDYPTDAKRTSGSHLKVRTTIGNLVVSRHRAKVIN